MTPRFRLKEGTLVAFIPGAGRLKPESVVEGEKFRKYVPSVLVEIEQEPIAEKVVDLETLINLNVDPIKLLEQPSHASEQIDEAPQAASISVVDQQPVDASSEPAPIAVPEVAVGDSIGTTEGALLVVDPNKPKRGRPRRS